MLKTSSINCYASATKQVNMKYTKDQLAELLRVPKRRISAWGSPSKKTIIVGSDDCIDDSIDKNMKFINKKLREVSLTPEEKELVIKKTPTMRKKVVQKEKVPTKNHNSTKKEPPKVAKEKEKPKELSPEIKLMNEADRRKSELQIVKLEQEARILKAKAEKAEGEFIDTAKALEAVRRWSMEKDKYLLQQLEKDIKYICDRESIPADRAARYRKKLPVTINQSSERATELLKKTF